MSDNEDPIEQIDLLPLFNQLVKALEECKTDYIDELITKSLIAPFADADYVEAGPFGSKPFLLRSEIATKLKKEDIPVKDRYTLSEYAALLTSYCIRENCINSDGIIIPTPFLCNLFKISTEPCTIVIFLGMATKILL
jgi:hypothetical protein